MVIETAATGRIVVGIDGSDQSRRALTWAATLADATDGHIEAVIAWQLPATFGWAVAPVDWDPAQDAHDILTKTVDDVFGSRRPRELTMTVVQGHPAHVLLGAAHGASMLVVGSRGHGGFGGMLLGSVSAYVAEHADCPVLVFHSEPALAPA
jgi:nucleotide-binding universal stress UspA family protein